MSSTHEAGSFQPSQDTVFAVLDKLLGEAQVGFAVISAEYTFLRVNAWFAYHYDLTLEAILGRPLAEVLPQAWETLASPLTQALQGEAVLHLEVSAMQLKLAPEHGEYFVLSFYPIRVQEQVKAIGLIVVDITELKRAQLEKGRLAHALGERVKEMTALHHAARVVQQEGVDTTRVLHELVSLLPPAFQFPEVTAARIKLDEIEASTAGFTSSLPTLRSVFKTEDGKTGTLEVVYLEEKPDEAEGPFLAEERALLNFIADLMRIAYDRNLSEEKSRRASALYESLVHTLDGIVWEADASTFSFTFVSRQAERILGYPVAQWLQEPGFWANHTHPDDRAWATRYCRDAIARGVDHQFEYRMIAADGHAVWLKDNVTFVARDDQPALLRGVMIDISEGKKIQEAMRQQAEHDALTQLPNRIMFQQRLTQALENAAHNNHLMGVLFLDLNRFKHINDTLGHPVGDKLLCQITSRLCSQVRHGDLLARMGGDEFTLLMPTLESAAEASQNGQRLLDSLKHPFHVDGYELYVSGSIGISIYPTDGQDPSSLLRKADVAMYQAKNRREGSLQLYADTMHQVTVEHLILEGHLRKAVERNELRLWYQPQISLCGDEVVGVEALLRWQHPEYGLVPPGDFIPLAEETGLILPLSEWVLREACRQAAIWQKASNRLIMSINLSARQFNDARLVDNVRSIIVESGVDASHIELELTETALMQNRDEATPILHSLKALGSHLALDDFGTGYSSLAYLKEFPLDVLKIDRYFISRLTEDSKDQALVQAMINVAHAFGMKVIAEGVETLEQKSALREMGCDIMQGYLFSRPVPPDEIMPLLTFS